MLIPVHPGEMSSPSRPQNLQLQHPSVAYHLCERRPPWRLLRLVADFRWLLLSGRWKNTASTRCSNTCMATRCSLPPIRTLVYLAASASAEFLADIALCPFEAIKVRMQTTLPPFASSLREGWGKVTAKEGVSGLYKGLYPLWGRQIPYTMVKICHL